MIRTRTRAEFQVSTESIVDLELRACTWLTAYAPLMMRLALAIVFLWFGVLKFFPGLSPAEDLAGRTITVLTGGHLAPAVSVPLLATWESAIGLGLLFFGPNRIALAMLLLEMPGTMLPILFFPHEVFTHFPYALSLEGQYIIKNLVLIAGACMLASQVYGRNCERIRRQ